LALSWRFGQAAKRAFARAQPAGCVRLFRSTRAKGDKPRTVDWQREIIEAGLNGRWTSECAGEPQPPRRHQRRLIPR
jgi:hypothetical protein